MAHSLNLSFAAFMLLTAVVLAACGHESAAHERLEMGDRTWTLEVAASEDAIRQGLMNRPDIPDGTGMLFVFPTPRVHEFWMANCMVDIDVIFIDGQSRITTLHQMKAEPPRSPRESVWQYHQRLPLYSSRIPVQFAIELPAGSIQDLNLHTGDAVNLDVRRLRSLAH